MTAVESRIRVPFGGPIRMISPDFLPETWGRGRDLGFGGMFVETTAPIPIGTPVSVGFSWPQGGWFSAEATAVRATPEGYGFRFHAIAPAVSAELASWIGARGVEPELRLAKLMGISERINAGVGLSEILDHLYDSFRPVIPYDRIGLALLKNRGRTVTSIWARSDTPIGEIDSGYSGPIRGSSLEVVARVKEPRILNDLEEYLRRHPGSDSTRRIVADGIRSSLTCPLIAQGRAIGFLFFSSRKPGAYSPDHVELFLDLSHQVSLAVERGLLFDDIERARKRLESANRKLERLSRIDRLTGVRNRRYLDQRLVVEWRRAKRSRRPLSLILVDVDCFKDFNDRHGHLAGDRCLSAVAKALRRSLRRPDEFVARYGGEEFAILLPDADPAVAISTAGILRRAVSDLSIPHGGSPVAPWVTISLGIASLSAGEGSEDPETLIAIADRELYRAKGAGRNRASISL